MKNNSYNAQNGNVLFIILLAVVLFGALTYAVTKGNSNSSDSGSYERAKIHASEILRYATNMRQAVDRMRNQGISENDIRFAHPDLDAAYGTFGTNPEAEVFHPKGGAMTYRKPKEAGYDKNYSTEFYYADWFFTARNYFSFVGYPSEAICPDDSCKDLAMLTYFLTKDVCMAINEQLGLSSYGTDPPLATGTISRSNAFTGDFSAGGVGIRVAPKNSSDADLLGLEALCLEGDTTPPSGTYHFYQVLIAR